jgi:3-oxoadipate enol-lactonase
VRWIPGGNRAASEIEKGVGGVSLISVDDGVRINVEADPENGKPTLIFSNSLGCDLHMWDPQVAPFRERFRLIRYDSRGLGKSDAPKGPYTIERLGRDVLAILDHFGVKQTNYVGLSQGGMIGQWLGVNAPGRLTRLALCNTAARVPEPSAFSDRAAAVRKNGVAPLIDGILARWFMEGFRQSHAGALAPIRATLAASDPEGYAACCEAIAGMDETATIKRIKTPTLVLVGDGDPATPPSSAEYIQGQIAGSKLVVIKNAAHITNIEQTAQFNKAVLEFLTG